MVDNVAGEGGGVVALDAGVAKVTQDDLGESVGLVACGRGATAAEGEVVDEDVAGGLVGMSVSWEKATPEAGVGW